MTHSLFHASPVSVLHLANIAHFFTIHICTFTLNMYTKNKKKKKLKQKENTFNQNEFTAVTIFSHIFNRPIIKHFDLITNW